MNMIKLIIFRITIMIFKLYLIINFINLKSSIIYIYISTYIYLQKYELFEDTNKLMYSIFFIFKC